MPAKERAHALYYFSGIDSGSNILVPSWDGKENQNVNDGVGRPRMMRLYPLHQ
jgi:hypothetical protein